MWISDDVYDILKKSFPIPCVDLIVVNEIDEILLVKRKNQPAKNQWWFPGGRVMHDEYRNVAAMRKLKEECGIISSNPVEWKTVEIFLKDNEQGYSSHGISTLYLICTGENKVKLDEQSSDFAWKSISEWKKIVTNGFIAKILEEFSHYKK